MSFPILTHDQLRDHVATFDAVSYCKSRNFVTGGVSRLSPYITHGVITIKDIVSLSLHHTPLDHAEQWYKELLRREYFVHIHYHQGNAIFTDMEDDKTGIAKADLLPQAIRDKSFGASWINETITELEITGYLHNHQRMWLAACLIHGYKLYRKKCADWTYYHFLDGELGSNHLSWQWVASTFSHKPYIMNEENIQKYRKKTVTDPLFAGSYEDVQTRLFDPSRPSEIHTQNDIYHTLITDLSDIPYANESYHDTIIVSPWDFHPKKITAPEKTICLLDPAFFARHPRSPARIGFIKGYCDLYHIPLVQGSIRDILAHSTHCTVYETRNPIYRDAYTQAHQKGHTLIPHERCSSVARTHYTKKFFPFWEKTSKHLYQMQREKLNM